VVFASIVDVQCMTTSRLLWQLSDRCRQFPDYYTDMIPQSLTCIFLLYFVLVSCFATQLRCFITFVSYLQVLISMYLQSV